MKTEFRKAIAVLLPAKNLTDIKEGTLMLHKSYDHNHLKLFSYSQSKNDASWIPYNLHIYLDKEIVNKGKTTAVCLDEVDITPNDAIVFNVGNCHGCREIIVSTDTALTDASVHKMNLDFLQYFINAYNQNDVVKEVEVEYEEIMGDEGLLAVTFGEDDYRIKVDSNDTAHVKRAKNNYTRKEVVELLHESMEATVTSHPAFREIFRKQLNEWIKKRL